MLRTREGGTSFPQRTRAGTESPISARSANLRSLASIAKSERGPLDAPASEHHPPNPSVTSGTPTHRHASAGWPADKCNSPSRTWPEPVARWHGRLPAEPARESGRSEEHTSELQSRLHLVCRLLLEKKKT